MLIVNIGTKDIHRDATLVVYDSDANVIPIKYATYQESPFSRIYLFLFGITLQSIQSLSGCNHPSVDSISFSCSVLSGCNKISYIESSSIVSLLIRDRSAMKLISVIFPSSWPSLWTVSRVSTMDSSVSLHSLRMDPISVPSRFHSNHSLIHS